jgi:hypothetical protein
VTSGPGQHDYLAQLFDRRNASVLSTSSLVSVVWTATHLTLSAATSTPTAGRPVVLTATVSRSLTGTPYMLLISDLTTKRPVARCFMGTTCAAPVVGAGAHTYQAVLLTPWGEQAQDGTPPQVTVTWPTGKHNCSPGPKKR